MRAEILSKEEDSLLYGLAEQLLQKGYSISFGEVERMEVLFASSETKQRLYIHLQGKDFQKIIRQICNIIAAFPTYKVVIPVVKEEEQRRLEKWLQNTENINLKISRFAPEETSALQNRESF